MQPFVDPARKLRSALSTCSPTHPSLDYFIRLAFRLPTIDENGHRDYRNTDPQTRQTSLHLAAFKGRIDVFEWLLDEGIDEAEISRDVVGDTVLHIAAAKGYAEIAELYLSRYPFVVEWVNSRGMSPLHVAAKEGQLQLAQIFLDAGADIDAPDLDGNTPLHYASAWGNVPVLRLLVDSDCQTDWRNNEGFTPAEFAFSFGVLKELEASIKQHVEDIRDARRQARKDRRSKRAVSTLQAKRIGMDSSLSISVPSPDPTADSSSPYSVGLGLSKQTSAESSADPNSHGGVPRLGAAVPPTPRLGSLSYPRELYRDPRPPLRETADSPPATPSSTNFMYPNTTSPQPSPSASVGSSAVPISAPIAASATGYGEARVPLRTVSTHSSLSHNIAAPTPVPASPAEAVTYKPASRKHSSSFGTASAALVQEQQPPPPRRREPSAPHSLAPPVLAPAPVPGLSPPAESDPVAAEIPSDWPPNATTLVPPPPSEPPHPVLHHNKLVKKSRAAGHHPASPPPHHGLPSPPRAGAPPPPPPQALPAPSHAGSPVLAQNGRADDDPASAYDVGSSQNHAPPPPPPPPPPPGFGPGAGRERLVFQQPQLPSSFAALPIMGTGTGTDRRSVSGPAATAVPASHFPRASFETDASGHTSATGHSSVIIGPQPIPRRPPGVVVAALGHDPRRVVSHAQLQQQQQQHAPSALSPNARSSIMSLPHAGSPGSSSTATATATVGARSGGREHHKLKKHRRVSTDLARTTSVSTANGSDRAEKSGGRLARAFGFGKKT